MILKGGLNEMWASKLPKVISTYTKADGSALGETDFADKDAWVSLVAIAEPDAYFAMHVPLDVSVTVTCAFGDELHTNLADAPHGDGDFLVCRKGLTANPT